jgi:hypothetical protein
VKRFVLPLLASLATCVVAMSCTSVSPTHGEPPCVASLSTACAPLYDPPTYDVLYAKIFHPTCASGTGTCHTMDAAKAGLVFEDADEAYAMLLGTNGAHVRVLRGDAACSLLVKRLASKDPSYHMPPGPTSLTDAELCTVTKWIANGAPR